MELNENIIGDMLRKYRKAAGITQYRLGKIAGIDNKTISRWESGVIKNMNILTFVKLMKVLGYTVSIGVYKQEEKVIYE